MSVITKHRESRKVGRSEPRKKTEPPKVSKTETGGDRASVSNESRAKESDKSKGRVGDITKGLTSYVSGTSAPSAKSKNDESEESIGVSTYNIGAGNEDAAKKENFEKTI